MATKKMNKTELYNTIVEELNGVGASEEVLAIAAKYLKPGVFGARHANLEEVVKRDGSGNITEVLDMSTKVFFPATLAYFYEDKTGKSKIVTEDGIHLTRNSRASEKIRKAFTREQTQKLNQLRAKYFSAENEGEAILTREDYSVQEAQIKAQKPDFSNIEEVAAELANA